MLVALPFIILEAQEEDWPETVFLMTHKATSQGPQLSASWLGASACAAGNAAANSFNLVDAKFPSSGGRFLTHSLCFWCETCSLHFYFLPIYNEWPDAWCHGGNMGPWLSFLIITLFQHF